MDEKICLDTDIVIEILKDTSRGKEFTSSISDKVVYLSAISVFELSKRTENLEIVQDFISKVNVLDFTERSAQRAASIHRELKHKGRMVDFRDVFIAATALTNGCALATLNKKHFKNMPGLLLFDG